MSVVDPIRSYTQRCAQRVMGSSECRQCFVEPEVESQLAALSQAVGRASTLTPACEVGTQSEGDERGACSL